MLRHGDSIMWKECGEEYQGVTLLWDVPHLLGWNGGKVQWILALLWADIPEEQYPEDSPYWALPLPPENHS